MAEQNSGGVFLVRRSRYVLGKNKKLEVVGVTQASDEKSCRRKGCICTGTTLFDLTKKTAYAEAIL